MKNPPALAEASPVVSLACCQLLLLIAIPMPGIPGTQTSKGDSREGTRTRGDEDASGNLGLARLQPCRLQTYS